MQLTKTDSKSKLGSEDIGFALAPRLNAAGRLGQAQLGVELLATQDAERAAALAEYINELNNNRLRAHARPRRSKRYTTFTTDVRRDSRGWQLWSLVM